MNLILGGGGDASDSKSVHQLLISRMGKGKKLLYIPVAWKGGDFDSCRAWFEATFLDLHFSNYEMWSNLNNKTEEDLNNFGGMYIGGGNTFSLLNILQVTKFDSLLINFIKSNRPVFGGSAGAIIFGKTIDTAAFCSDPDKNEVSLQNTNGFNLVNDYDIQCHYLPSQDEEIMEFVKNNKTSVIALSQRSGLSVTDQGMTIVGFEPGYIFTYQGKMDHVMGHELC